MIVASVQLCKSVRPENDGENGASFHRPRTDLSMQMSRYIGEASCIETGQWVAIATAGGAPHLFRAFPASGIQTSRQVDLNESLTFILFLFFLKLIGVDWPRPALIGRMAD